MSIANKKRAAARALKLAETTRTKTFLAHEGANNARDKARKELKLADQGRLDAYHLWMVANERLEQAEYAVETTEFVHARESRADSDALDACSRAHLELAKYIPNRKFKRIEERNIPF